jgi:hypothetical protein
MKLKDKIIIGCAAVTLAFGATSCTDYLDKTADSTVSPDEAFKNFTNFQGFVEQNYNCIPDKIKNYWTTTWNWGEDEIMDPQDNWHMINQVDQGNFWAWQANRMEQPGQWLDKPNADPTSDDKFNHALWPHAWYCIRQCNLGLENMDKMTSATEEERNFVKGQLYFFRAWWHFQMMQYLGGLPYIRRSFEPLEKLTLPRLSFQECADSCAEDLRMAADLLPINWDNTTVGAKTKGKNDIRVTKIAALGYLGKVYLWAGSPLNVKGAETGASVNGDTYAYDKAYCQKAAEAFGELLALVEGGQTQYALAEFKYKNIYDHTRAADAKSCFSDIFYTTGQNWLMPGSTEAIFRGPSQDYNGTNWGSSKTFGPGQDNVVESGVTRSPTANYINYAYGMKNGLPITDPESGFDPTHPFKDRDPRFYHDIVFDGFKYVNSSMPANMEKYRYCDLATAHANTPNDSIGNMRDEQQGSRTGYFYQKLCPHQSNKYDGLYNWSGALHIYLPYMRLGDVYTMYAEACAAVGGAKAKASNFQKTAEDAINTLRDRVGEGHVAAKIAADQHKFIDEVRRERAAELAFEGFRFVDLQRWLLLTEAPYTVKTSQQFTRVTPLSYLQANGDPANIEVRDWSEKTILTRKFNKKHYWFPLKVNDTSMYPEFGQNEGW